MVVSTRSSRPLEEVPAGPWWLQVYVVRDRGLTRALVQRAAAAGATALVLTGDTPYLGQRAALGRAPLPPEQEQDPPSASRSSRSWRRRPACPCW
jgi:4-hydroxymandelate oxidase